MQNSPHTSEVDDMPYGESFPKEVGHILIDAKILSHARKCLPASIKGRVIARVVGSLK